MYCKNCGTKLKEGANFCQNCGKGVNNNPDKKHHDAKDAVDVEYFSMSPGRLATLSILTVGLYEIYWFYKNWKAIKEFEEQRILPFWRAVFAIIFCYSLFKKVLTSAKKHGYKNGHSSGWLAVAYISIILISNFMSRVEPYDISLNVFWLIITLSSFVPLLFVQDAINFNNQKLNDNSEMRKNFSGGEVAILIIGIFLLFLVLVGVFLP